MDSCFSLWDLALLHLLCSSSQSLLPPHGVWLLWHFIEIIFHWSCMQQDSVLLGCCFFSLRWQLWFLGWGIGQIYSTWINNVNSGHALIELYFQVLKRKSSLAYIIQVLRLVVTLNQFQISLDGLGSGKNILKVSYISHTISISFSWHSSFLFFFSFSEYKIADRLLGSWWVIQGSWLFIIDIFLPWNMDTYKSQKMSCSYRKVPRLIADFLMWLNKCHWKELQFQCSNVWHKIQTLSI